MGLFRLPLVAPFFMARFQHHPNDRCFEHVVLEEETSVPTRPLPDLACDKSWCWPSQRRPPPSGLFPVGCHFRLDEPLQSGKSASKKNCVRRAEIVPHARRIDVNTCTVRGYARCRTPSGPIGGTQPPELFWEFGRFWMDFNSQPIYKLGISVMMDLTTGEKPLVASEVFSGSAAKTAASEVTTLF